VDCAGAESLGFVEHFGERSASISECGAERNEHGQQRAAATEFSANTTDSAAGSGGSIPEHRQHFQLGSDFELERYGNKYSGQNAAAHEHTIDLRLQHEHNAVAATVADLQCQWSAAAVGGYGLDQLCAFQRHLRFERHDDRKRGATGGVSRQQRECRDATCFQ
jgi:hypothetical protein